MTILGDKVQTMAENRQDVLTFLPKIFGKEVHRVYLNKSYRSTSEITEFASRLLQEENVQTVERHGELPQTISCHSTEEMYETLAEDIKNREDAETIAVLCLDAADAKKTAEQLQAKLPEDIPVTLLTKDSMKFGRGISVMPFYLAKGLEFDAVFIPETEKYVTPLHKQALYIDATRALHFLRLYEVQI